MGTAYNFFVAVIDLNCTLLKPDNASRPDIAFQFHKPGCHASLGRCVI